MSTRGGWVFCVGLLLLVSTEAAGFPMATGSYTGTGADNRAITGLGFTPAFVMVKSSSGSTFARSATVTGDNARDLDSTTMIDDAIQSLDATGFTLGTRLNGAGITFHWLAFAATAGELVAGTYTGNGTDDRLIGVGFTPGLVVLFPDGNGLAHYRVASMPVDSSPNFSGGGGPDRIQTFEATGFQLGGSNSVNRNGTLYHYVAWRNVANQLTSGSYTGNAADDRNITDVGFQPDWVLVQQPFDVPYQRFGTTPAASDLSAPILGGFVANGIQALLPTGFQVGTDANVNQLGNTFHWVALARPPAGLLPNGSACASAGVCASGFCADGVCCNAGCGSSTTDCQACSVAAGAAADGT